MLIPSDALARNHHAPLTQSQLAKSWDWSADKLTLTLHLRPGVVFSDGAPLDAEAVRANIERYRKAP